MVLNLKEGNTLANAMDSPGRDCEDISGSHTDTVHQVMKIFPLDPLQDLPRGDPVLKAQVYPASRSHGQDMPNLVPSHHWEPLFHSIGITGVDLDGMAFCGGNEFQKQGERCSWIQFHIQAQQLLLIPSHHLGQTAAGQ